jgi:hypothetical protein
MTTTRRTTTALSLVAAFLVMGLSAALQAQTADTWQKENVDWKAGAGRRIKSIRFPKDKRPPRQAVSPEGEVSTEPSQMRTTKALAGDAGPMVLAIDVNNPPVDGFVPWIAIGVTSQRKDSFEFDAVVEHSVVGSYPSGVNPQNDYMIGIFDTGAGGHVIGYNQANLAHLTGSLVSPSQTTVYGVVGSLDVWVSQPLGLFIDGLAAIDPASTLLNTSGMMGESNVVVMVGEAPSGTAPDLATAIGPPLSVYYTTEIRNDKVRTIVRGGQTYSGPDIRVFAEDDPCAPEYANIIPLELRPLGGVNVQYITTIPDLGDIDSWLDDPGPASPSVIMGVGSQSLFFVSSVDLYEKTHAAMDKTRFMLDTGAQVSVIGSRIAARLGLTPSAKEFEVEIEDVTGEAVMAPGFYVDMIQIPALGEWFTARNVPMVLLDVTSPEGGTLDGIVGMNLFVNFNLVVRGGGLFLQQDPALEFQPIGTLPATN